MRQMRFSFFLCLALAGLFVWVGTSALGCGDDDDDPSTSSGQADDDGVDDDADDDVTDCGPAEEDWGDCGPEELCEQAVICKLYGKIGDCVPWYGNPENCSDMVGYVQCHYDTLDEMEDCVDFEAYGVSCFNQFCGSGKNSRGPKYRVADR